MRIIGLVVALFLAASPLRATVLVPAGLGELTRDARAIARGRVVALDAQWATDHRTIETIVSLEVEAYLKGSMGALVRFRVPGGTLGRFRSILVGAPEFSLDQQIVVFLGARGPGVPYVLGLSQGVFRVVPAESGRGWIVRGGVSRGPVPLASFEANVREMAGTVR